MNNYNLSREVLIKSTLTNLTFKFTNAIIILMSVYWVCFNTGFVKGGEEMAGFTGEDIKIIRKKIGFSQQKFSQLLGLSWITISRWERNINKPLPKTFALLKRLAQLIDLIYKAIPREKIGLFLVTPHKLLYECHPMDLLKNDYGFEVLQEFIKSAKSGDMS